MSLIRVAFVAHSYSEGNVTGGSKEAEKFKTVN